MSFWKSIRFRLSVQYSAVVFGLGGGVLGLVYLALRKMLRAQTMTQQFHSGQIVELNGVRLVVPLIEEREMRTIESLVNEHILDQLARYMVISLIGLFLISLVVGWFMSGQLLRPVERITQVARDIQASDLSRRIALEGPDDELTRLASTFDGMLERLETAFRSQRRFLADTSHDLRTPLAVIRSNVEVVTDDERTTLEEWKEVGGIVTRNVDRMSQMIDGLLAVARYQAGRAEAVSVDLATLVSAKCDELLAVAAAKGVSLEAVANPAIVEGVEVALDRALSNLLDNAIRVSPHGGSVVAGSGVVEGWAWMAVADAGPGLPESGGEGVGLGLGIVRQVADAHGGSMVARSGLEGDGTIMTIWLPTPDSSDSHPIISPLEEV